MSTPSIESNHRPASAIMNTSQCGESANTDLARLANGYVEGCAEMRMRLIFHSLSRQAFAFSADCLQS